MLQHQTSVKAVIRGQTREPITLKGGITKLRSLSHSIGISRDSSQQGSAVAKMSPSRETTRSRRQSKRWDGGEEPGENEDTGSPNGEASRNAGNSPEASQSSDIPGASALVVAIRKTSSQLQESQEATKALQEANKALLEACNKYTKEFDQFPVLLERFNKKCQEATFKGEKIKKQTHTIEILNEEISKKKQAVKDATEANSDETKRLQAEREELEKQKAAFVEDLKAKDALLDQEANEKLSRLDAELAKKYQDSEKALKSDMEKEKKKLSEELAKLRKTIKDQQETINDQKAQIDKKNLELTSKDSKYEDAAKLVELYKAEKGEVSTQLKDLQEEYALDSKPLIFYEKKFLEISQAIKNITSRYLARDLNTQEIRKLRKKMIAADPAFSDVPFSNTELSVQLRKLHAQRVISHALHKTVWQNFSSEKSVADPMLPKSLQEIEAEVFRSEMMSHNSSRMARLWKALTVSAINSKTTDIKTQEDRAQILTSSHSPQCRTDKVIIDVLSVLEPLLDASTLPRFNLELFHLVNNAISVWTSAQVDEQMFTIFPTLDEQNKRDWTDVTLENNSSNADIDRQQEAGSVFMLFPVVITKKNIPLPNAPPSAPGSFPEQDQQSPNIEVTVVHKGLGLPETSEIVQIGKDQHEARRILKYKLDEPFTEDLLGKIRGHSRQSSMAETSSGPSSPIASWLSNGKNGIASEF